MEKTLTNEDERKSAVFGFSRVLFQNFSNPNSKYCILMIFFECPWSLTNIPPARKSSNKQKRRDKKRQHILCLLLTTSMKKITRIATRITCNEAQIQDYIQVGAPVIFWLFISYFLDFCFKFWSSKIQILLNKNST